MTAPTLNCPCGHSWMAHDVDEFPGDGSETCCVEGCDQTGCPGRTTYCPYRVGPFPCELKAGHEGRHLVID